YLWERRELEELGDHGAGAAADVVQGQAEVDVHVREGVRQVGGVAVVRVAVQQDHRDAGGLCGAQEGGQQGRVGAVQGEVGVAEPGVHLHRQAAVESGPQQVP